MEEIKKFLFVFVVSAKKIAAEFFFKLLMDQETLPVTKERKQW